MQRKNMRWSNDHQIDHVMDVSNVLMSKYTMLNTMIHHVVGKFNWMIEISNWFVMNWKMRLHPIRNHLELILNIGMMNYVGMMMNQRFGTRFIPVIHHEFHAINFDHANNWKHLHFLRINFDHFRMDFDHHFVRN